MNMTLGQKIKEARIERKMTQKDVVGDYITRNMLSRIENDSATPSVKTLEYIARALQLPAGYFLSDLVSDTGLSGEIVGARTAYRNGDFLSALDLINTIDLSRSANEEEACLLRAKCCLGLAIKSEKEGNLSNARAYAREALKHNASGLYFDYETELNCCQIIMLWTIRNRSADFSMYEKRYLTESGLGNLNERFAMLRALRAYTEAGSVGAAPILGPIHAEDLHDTWSRAVCLHLKGIECMAAGQYREALERIGAAEHEAEGIQERILLNDIYASLEICYRELDDFKMAYYYATHRLDLKIGN